MNSVPSIKGRGAAANPVNRFEEIALERNLDDAPEEARALLTRFFKDQTKTIIARNDSPDVGFETSVNPYRGCEHGCIYCFARPTHEYLGFSLGLDFESKVMVKLDAPALLEKELSSAKWTPQVIALSGVTDCYQPIESKLRLTRSCLEVLLKFRNPACIVTKNHLVTRDIDLLRQMAAYDGVAVYVSVTTLDPALTPKMEPRASLPNHRLDAIRQLSAAGVPVGVMVAPVILGLTDHEMPKIIEAAAAAGACGAGYVPLRLPFGVADLFTDWLERHFPERKEKVLGRIRQLRGGKLNDPNFVTRMEGEGIFAEHLSQLFAVACRRAGLEGKKPKLSTAAFRKPAGRQLELL